LFIELKFTTNIKTLFTSVNARMDTFDNGLPHTFTGPGAVVNGLSFIKNMGVKRLFIFIWS